MRAIHCPDCGAYLAGEDHKQLCRAKNITADTQLEVRAAGGLLSAPAMLYGHHEEVLVRLIQEQNALIAHLVHAAADRGWWARPNGTQLIAHQRAASLDTMLQHMGLVRQVDRG